MRNTLTQKEIDTIAKLTHNTKLDGVFDVHVKRTGTVCFKDFENNKTVAISTGLKWLYDGLAYSLYHDGLNEEEAGIIIALFNEFNVKGNFDWLTEKENDMVEESVVVTVNNGSVEGVNSMMTEKEYAQEVINLLKGFIADDVVYEIQEIMKNNGAVLTAIMFKGERNVSPCMYVTEPYKHDIPVTECAKQFANAYETSKNDFPNFDISEITDFEKAKDKIIMVLVNKELNANSDIVGIPFLDLMIIFKIVVDNYNGAFVTIKKEMINCWGVDENKLLEVAKENTPKIFPHNYKNIFEVMKDQLDPEVLKLMGIEEFEGMPNVLTNNNSQLGAAVILYDGVLKDIAKGEDLVILPSSIHEVLIIKAKQNDSPDELKAMVQDVNATQVALEERLSDNVYKYNAKLDKIEILG